MATRITTLLSCGGRLLPEIMGMTLHHASDVRKSPYVKPGTRTVRTRLYPPASVTAGDATKRGPPLEPLRDRKTRVKLLLSSYHDACEAVQDDLPSHAEQQSRLLSRNLELWGEGCFQLARAEFARY